MTAIVLNDYPGKHYATWVEQQKKTIETRMKGCNYRGDIVICCGGKSVTDNAGKALCIVNLYEVRDMQDSDADAACIENAPNRKAYLLKDWRFFKRKFKFSKMKVSGSFQWLFQIAIPDELLNSEQNVQECDASKADQGTEAGQTKTK